MAAPAIDLFQRASDAVDAADQFDLDGIRVGARADALLDHVDHIFGERGQQRDRIAFGFG